MTQPHPGGATSQRPHSQNRGTARRWVLPGLAAGGLFLVLEMLVGSFTTTVWAFPEGIAHTIGIGAHGYGLQLLPLLAGVIVHLSASVGLGALFTVVADRLRLAGTVMIIAAWLFSGVETAVAIRVVLPTFLPGTLPMLLHSVPLWASIVGHNVYGLTLGFLLSTHDRATSRHAPLLR
jgi:hypothetical protein